MQQIWVNQVKEGIIVYFSTVTVLTTKQILFLNRVFEEYHLAEGILPDTVYIEVPVLIRLKVRSCLLILFKKCVTDVHHICC